MSHVSIFAFGIYPYIAVAIMFIASWIRYDREQYTWKASSSQLMEKKQLQIGSVLFHLGILGILGGHFVGLLTPAAIWHALGISAAFKQMMAMIAGGIAGGICFIGLTILLHRRLTHDRVRATGKKMDVFILVLLYAQLILGLISIPISSGHLDGSEMLKLMAWAQNIVTFNSFAAVDAISDVHWVFKLHIFLGMTLLVVFPFTRLVHILSAPIQYLGRAPQIVRRKVRS